MKPEQDESEAPENIKDILGITIWREDDLRFWEQPIINSKLEDKPQ